MGLLRDAASYYLSTRDSGDSKRTASPGETPGQESLDRAAKGDSPKRSITGMLEYMGQQRLNKRSNGKTRSY